MLPQMHSQPEYILISRGDIIRGREREVREGGGADGREGEREKVKERDTETQNDVGCNHNTLTVFPEAVSMPSTNVRMATNNDTARLK